MTLPYDNTNGNLVGVAIANLSSVSVNIAATIWDDSGDKLGSQTLVLGASGHSAFVLSTNLPLTVEHRGLIQFETDGKGGIAGLGLRFSQFGTFTDLPPILP